MKPKKQANQKIWLALFVIFAFGLLLRLLGLNWDQGYYLHPDERFLVMTLTSLKWPTSLAQYLNPQTSLLNPYNMGVNFFVYGHFPLILAKGLSQVIGFNDYVSFFWLGRTLSALVDASVILAVFFIAKKVFAKHPQKLKLALFSSLSYSLMVLPLQQAHFFTTDAFFNAFSVWAVAWVLFSKKHWLFLLLSALFFSLSLASKINAVLVLPLILWLIIYLHNQRGYKTLFVYLGLFTLTSYSFLRLADPYLFNSPNWLILWIDSRFLQNLKELSSLGKSVFFPPGVQWHNTNWILPAKNLFLFGLGPGLTVLLFIGLTYLWFYKKQLGKQSVTLLIIIGLWLLAWFIFQSSQLSKTMRYYLILYPFFGLFIAIALFYLKKSWRLLLLIPALIWLLSFINIYAQPHARITASDWLNQNLTTNSVIVTEYWDDPLPLRPDPTKQLKILQLDFYETDSIAKWRRLAKILKNTNYLVLSSNRLYGSIPQVPDLYPYTSVYYQKLLDEELGFKLIKTFVVFPKIEIGSLKLEFNDQTAEEAFTVYDHPQVLIFKRQKNFNEARFLRKIGW